MQVLDNYGATVWFVLREAREDGSPMEASQALSLVNALDLAEKWTEEPYDFDGTLVPTNAGISLYRDAADGLFFLFHKHKTGWLFTGGKRNVDANAFVKQLRAQAFTL